MRSAPGGLGAWRVSVVRPVCLRAAAVKLERLPVIFIFYYITAQQYNKCRS